MAKRVIKIIPRKQAAGGKLSKYSRGMGSSEFRAKRDIKSGRKKTRYQRP